MCTSPELDLFPVTGKLRSLRRPAADGAQDNHWYYCPGCETSGHDRATALAAALDLQAHRCDPVHTQIVAAVWTEVPGLSEVVAALYRDDDPTGPCPQQLASDCANLLRAQVGPDVVQAGLFTVAATMSLDEIATEIETRLRERHDV